MIEIKNEDNYKDVFFGEIVFRLNNDKDVQSAHKIIKEIFGEDKFNFGIEGGTFTTKKTRKSILLKYFGNVGSRFYKLFFKDLIKEMKNSGIEISYNKVDYKNSKFYNLDDEKSIIDYLEK